MLRLRRLLQPSRYPSRAATTSAPPLWSASAQSSFVHFIYQVSSVMVAPFAGIFGDTGNKTNTFETASLVAIVVYAVIGWGLVVLIRIVTAPHGTKPASS
jgi:hypothetical protein